MASTMWIVPVHPVRSDSNALPHEPLQFKHLPVAQALLDDAQTFSANDLASSV